LEEVEVVVVQNEGVDSHLVGFDWYVVNVGLNLKPVGDLVRAVVDDARRIHTERSPGGQSVNTQGLQCYRIL
jgi:hypothetical protein